METNPFRAQRLSTEGAGEPGPSGHPPSGRPGRAPEGTVTAWLEDRVAGQTWYYRVPLLLLMAWWIKNHLADPMYSSILFGITLGFHEAGHAAFMWTGHRMLIVAGGTIFELGIPIVAGAYLLYKQRDPFGTSFCLFWLGSALVSSGIYAADALVQQLPLVSPFGPVDPGSHDWTTMLMKVGRLSQAEEIGGTMQTAGKVTMVASVVLGAWILRVMARTKATDSTRR